jgi:hypothetical protein
MEGRDVVFDRPEGEGLPDAQVVHAAVQCIRDQQIGRQRQQGEEPVDGIDAREPGVGEPADEVRITARLAVCDVYHHEAGNDEEQVHAGKPQRPLPAGHRLAEEPAVDLRHMPRQHEQGRHGP